VNGCDNTRAERTDGKYETRLNRRTVAPRETNYRSCCLLHVCKELECNQQARDPDEYCGQSHSCETAGCRERRSSSPANIKFCTNHECKHPACRTESNVPGGYCLTNGDGCQKPECKEPRQSDDSDELCAKHYIKQLKDNWEKERQEDINKVKREMEEQSH
jgi:hypothetical protein